MPVVERRAQLTGDAFDPEDFPLWTEGCEYTVREVDGAYFLCLLVTLVGTDPGIVMDLLGQYGEQLNGIGNLLQGSYRPIRVEHGLLGRDANGAPVSRSMRARWRGSSSEDGHDRGPWRRGDGAKPSDSDAERLFMDMIRRDKRLKYMAYENFRRLNG